VGIAARFWALGKWPLAIDEYYFAQSVQNVLHFGIPEFPCGGLYVRGLLLQYASALLQLAGDHVASALDGRESAFELHANGGIPAWRGRMRRYFGRYNELANGVLRALNVDMPEIDLDILRAAPLSPRRPVTPPTPKAPPPASA